LIACGILALIVAIWQYRWTLRYMWSGDFALIAGMTREGLRTPIVAIAVVLTCVGLFAFLRSAAAPVLAVQPGSDAVPTPTIQ
jgi:putative membrane protein